MLNRSRSVAPGPDRHAWGADKSAQKEQPLTPHLVFQNLRATINQPLPLGIALNNSTGGETLVLSGFVEGTSLSAGTKLSTTRWSVPARDLDKAFISAPQDFDGIMQVKVTLYSATQDVLQAKQVQFEWGILQKGDKLPLRSPAQDLAK
jgi:hypothetical protein